MRFEEPSLTAYLVKNLEPLTEADPTILAEYVVALLKKEKTTDELQRLCSDNLVEFLGDSSKSFVTNLFQVLQDGSFVGSSETSDATKKPELSRSPNRADSIPAKGSSPKKANPSTSDSLSNPEDQEVSDDDDDDDRNHKHRRREARPNSFDEDAQEQVVRRPGRKRSKPYENGRTFPESHPQPRDMRREYNTFAERDLSSEFEMQRIGVANQMRAPFDLGPRTRVSQALLADSALRFDLSSSMGRPPIGRGRGRSMGLWNQHESRFNMVEALDFAPPLATQGRPHTNIFMGAGLPSAGSTQSPSWGGFAFPGMSGRILDPLHPLGLQGTLPPVMAPPLNLRMPRQRCRDFEERGFCLRGDMCPMEHGVNRIVVEDVQSLSQFNLPVSLASSRAPGIQAGMGSLAPLNATSSISANNKVPPSRSSKSMVADDGLRVNGVPSTSGDAEADVYDPDQPLWNSNRAETSTALLSLPSPNIDDEPIWDPGASAHQNLTFSDGLDSEGLMRNSTADLNSRSATSSVWGRVGAGNKSEPAGRTDTIAAASYVGKEMKDNHEKVSTGRPAPSQGKSASADGVGPKGTTVQSLSRNRLKASQKASRTLYVNGIPQQNNRREALLSHFQKFGEVIDIYIPFNSEKAFVQFSKREEAEAALKAPDAVMGNRFIKLWWANRDSIVDEGQSNPFAKLEHPTDQVNPSPQPPAANNGKGNLTSVVQKGSSAPAPGTSLPAVGPKSSAVNGPKATPPVQKKLETLELLKEEIRKKQELLDQKRDDFRRQLDKLGKQAVSVYKGETVPEQAVKRQKLDRGSDVAKAATPGTATICLETTQEDEKTPEKSKPVEVLISPSSIRTRTILQQLPRTVKQTSCLPTPLPNRFKLDNRPTSFRILPPIPEDFANVASMKEHFATFGELSSVTIEDSQAQANIAGEPSANLSAIISFTTRRSAERAFLTGKCWQGHSLQFKWLTVSPNSSNECGTQESNLTSNHQGFLSASTPADAMIPGPSSSIDVKSVSDGIHEAARNDESVHDVQGTRCASVTMDEVSVQTSQSTPVVSSCEKQLSEVVAPMIEDSSNVSSHRENVF